MINSHLGYIGYPRVALTTLQTPVRVQRYFCKRCISKLDDCKTRSNVRNVARYLSRRRWYHDSPGRSRARTRVMDSALRNHTGRPGLFLLVLALALASICLTWRGETRRLISITARVRFDDASSRIVNPRVEARSTSTSVGEERARESTGKSSRGSKPASFSVDGATATHRRASKLRCERTFAVNGKAQFSCYMKHACVSFPRQSMYGATPLDPPYDSRR